MRGKSSALRAKEKFLALYHDGAFEAGTKIPSESSMAEMLGVSRETWRKALGLLRGEGVLVFQTRLGHLSSGAVASHHERPFAAEKHV